MGREEKLAVERTTILETEFAQHCCSRARSPVQTVAFVWLRGDLNKADKTRKAKWVVLCHCNPSDPVASWLGKHQRQHDEEWEHTPWAGEDGLLQPSVQRSLNRVVEPNLKDCWYKLSLCCEYLIWLWSICIIIVCMCGQKSSYDCLFLFWFFFMLVYALTVMFFCLCL